MYGETGETLNHSIFNFLVNGKSEKAYTLSTVPRETFMGLDTVRKHNITYYNIPAAFDIETTSTIKDGEPYAFMYHWQFCLNETVIFGRTWTEYLELLKMMTEYLELNEYRRLVVWVHNLSYEFQFLYSRHPITYTFARKERKPVIALSGGIEYRCSYFLSNMSLRKFCENSPGVLHYKQDNYNYIKYRDSNTKLTPKELGYCFCDVKGLCEAVAFRLKEDTIASIPMTSTGYVRRDIREYFTQDMKWKTEQKRLALTLELYILCKEAFRGGDTHANALYSGMILEEVYSADEQSSYPGAIMIDKFPMTPFIPCAPGNVNKAIKSGKCAIFRVHLHKVVHKVPYGIPYIPHSKCRGRINTRCDNGRILSADDLEITVTDLDWKIICRDYNFEFAQISSSYIAGYDYLPEPIRRATMDYFIQKSELKGKHGMEYEYMKSKNRINSIYGMMVTDILMDDIIFDGEWGKKVIDNPEEVMDKYYNSRSSFLSYQWGVWVTANSRMRLREMIWEIGNDVVYVDTDSVKYINRSNHVHIERKNGEIMEKVLSSPIQPRIEVKGKTYIMPLWEREYGGEHFRFRTLGAKKYIVQKKKSRPVITVAGVDKKAGSDEIYYKARHMKKDPLVLFDVGFVFEAAHHTTAHYNDGENSNLVLENGNYTLGITGEYMEIISKNLLKN